MTIDKFKYHVGKIIINVNTNRRKTIYLLDLIDLQSVFKSFIPTNVQRKITGLLFMWFLYQNGSKVKK